MSSKTEVAIGDRFTKVSGYRMPVWKVARISRRNREPPHAHLEKEGAGGDCMTISVPALTDETLFRRVSA